MEAVADNPETGAGMRKILIGVVVVAIIGVGVYANLNRTPTAVVVQVAAVSRRDLTATVTGSGKIRPAREVDISSNVMGQITQLAVEEGEQVQAGDFLLRIDPVRYRSAVEQVEASYAVAETNLELARENLTYARDVLDRREGLYQQDLLSREAYLEAVQAVEREQRTVRMREQEIDRLRAQLSQVQHDLSQVTFAAPITGVITKLNIEEGETAITGTMNNPGTVLLTIADLSVVEAEIEIDETDIVHVELGQPAIVRVDAFPDREYAAEVVEVGRSPISTAASSSSQAINFKVVVRVLEPIEGARPGLSCTADIVTATRNGALAVPIQSLILREVRVDEEGNIVEGDPLQELLDQVAGRVDTEDDELEELEGAFVVRDGTAHFAAIEIGIAGERHFEVLSGLEDGEEVIIGPFDVIRTLQSGDRVQTRNGPAPQQTDGTE